MWRLKVLIGIDASRAVVGTRTGTEVYSLNVIRELLRLDGGHQFRLYFRQPPDPSLGVTGGKEQTRLIGPPRLWTHVGLSWEVMRHRPDVLFIPAHVVPLARRCPTVVTVHDVGYLDYPEAYTRSRWLSLHWSTAFSVRAATLIIADSHYTKSEIIKRYGVRPEKIQVVHLACEDGLAPVESPDVIRETKNHYGIDGEYFVYLGTLQPRKNVGGLLKAYAAFKARAGSRAKLVLVGQKGWLFESVFRSVRELGLEDDVVFTGYMPDQDVPTLLSGAMALVFPSFYEGFGLPALQAMACGTPVIASNVTSLPEVVGEAGLLIDPHDSDALAAALEKVASDAHLREDLRQRGLQRAKQFSWETCAAETMRVLEKAGS